ncbi:MAG: hypothetical protein IPL32_17760 [Chloracidobacterium sp.]|nr:hypothetical protein [Chloracidobacterium sp.]
MAAKNLTITQGKTFSLVLRWEAPPVIFKPITGATQTAPVNLTVAAHGVPEGWRVAVTNVKGMTDINAPANEVKDSDYHQATVIDASTIQINDINAAGFKPYVSGGYIQYNTPVVLTGFTARMSIKDKVGGTELLSLTTENGGIAIDLVRSTISLTIAALATAALTWKTGVYDLELVSGDVTPVVTALLTGKVTVTKEVTT